MDERSDHKLIAGLIAAAARPSAAGTRDLATLTAHCWPGGSDRGDAIAAQWLRRWHPKRALVAPPRCVCPAGRCEACN
jgi:hypothetical protein